jgi:recombinational DNA repair protein (RecF pathway)
MNFMANQQYRSQTTIQATESKDKATQERQTHCEHKIVRSMGYSTDVPRCVHCGASEKEAQELAEQYLAKVYPEHLYVRQLANVQKPGQELVPLQIVRMTQKDFIKRKEKMAADALNRAFYYGDHHDDTEATEELVPKPKTYKKMTCEEIADALSKARVPERKWRSE